MLQDQQEAAQLGVQGVPFYVFNRKYAVSGAQPSEVFAQVLNKVLEKEKPALIIEQGEGSCDINGNCNKILITNNYQLPAAHSPSYS